MHAGGTLHVAQVFDYHFTTLCKIFWSILIVHIVGSEYGDATVVRTQESKGERVSGVVVGG